MNIQHLRYFLATYDSRSYARAAKILFISRQALRQQLRRLENELGAPLFLSNGKMLVPTEEGEWLNKECRHIVYQFDNLEQRVTSLSPKACGELKIELGFGAVTFLNPDLLLEFQDKYPEILLQVTENSDTVVIDDVMAGHVTLGIIGASTHQLGKVDSIRIQKSGLYLLVHKDNPLSDREIICPEDLDGVEFVSFGEQNHAHWYLHRECSMHSCAPRFIFCTQDVYSAVSIARKYKAVTWSYPPRAAENYNYPDFRIIPLKISDASWGTYIISRKGEKITPTARILMRHIVMHAVDV